jgi:hypothetical protein
MNPRGLIAVPRNPSDDAMRVPEFVLKSVALVGTACGPKTSKSDITDISGTGFVVGVPSRVITGYRFWYFITAKHIIDKIVGGNDVPVMIANSESGLEIMAGTMGEWRYHPSDLSCDVAARAFDWTQRLELLAIEAEHLLTTPRIEQLQIGIGNEIFMPGLFAPAANFERLHPIIRYGNIAMLPPEPIQTRKGAFTDLYLMEVRSIGGLSGAPVFVRQTVSYGPAGVKDHADWIYGTGGRHYLLGMARSHWDIEESDINKYFPAYTDSEKGKGVNMGIGIVTPSYKIIETLNHPAFVLARDAFDTELRKVLPN